MRLAIPAIGEPTIMTKLLPLGLAFLVTGLSLVPGGAQAGVPMPQLVELGTKLGWTPAQTAQVNDLLADYSAQLDRALYHQAELPVMQPRLLLEDVKAAHQKYRKDVEQVLGAEGMKGYLAVEEKPLGLMNLKAAIKQLGGMRVPLELSKEQMQKLAPSLARSRYASFATVLEAAEVPDLPAHGLTAMATRLDQIKFLTDKAVFEVLTPTQEAIYKKKRAQATELTAAIREKRQEGYEGDLATINRAFEAGRPLGRWKEGLMFEGIVPTEGVKSGGNWIPGSETLRPEEMRVTFMGTSPRLPRPGQLGASVYVELGNGDKFIFDFGEAAFLNYLAAGVPFNLINDIFVTNLEWSNLASIPYMYEFGAWAGRWHEPFRIYGPSGRTPELGLKHMLEQMRDMLTWHTTSFNLSPIGKGFDIDAHEFDFRDDGGIVYEKNGVKVTHWRQSHLADGASAYRLDWNGMCLVYTGNGRPSSITARFATGCDLVITAIKPEIVPIASVAEGTLPILARAALDMGGNPAYAAGYLYSMVKPRLAIGTHVDYDAYSFEEIVAEVRENWKGPFHVGVPDMMVVNMNKDWIWVRDGIVPEFPSTKPPKFDNGAGEGMVIPAPRNLRKDVQEQFIRDAQIPPKEYYPPAYEPELLELWPTDKAIYVPWFMMDEKMLKYPLEETK